MKILVTPTSLQPGKKSEALELLKEYSSDLVFNKEGRPLTEDELIPLLKDCDGYIAGLDDVSAKVIESCPKLKVISRYGVGFEKVDTKAASGRGIKVTNTPGANSEAVGELAFALLLCAARKIAALNASTRQGGWERSSGIELKGKNIGILGLGAIGKVVARCAQGFGMHVLAYDPYINEAYCQENDIRICTWDEILQDSDVFSLHMPLLESTRHMINAEAIAKMRDGVILINASRGGIIDESAVYDGLKSGKIAGLGLDAFEQEPPKDSPLFEFDNVIATPHTGAHTKEATNNMAMMAIRNLIQVLDGQECRYVVNR